MKKYLSVFIALSSLMFISPVFAAPPVASVEVTNFPAVQDVNVTNHPASQDVVVTNLPVIQDVEVTNFPASMDVRVLENPRIYVRGSVTSGTVSGHKTFYLHAYTLNDYGTNYGRVPAGKKLVLTDFNIRHAVNTTTGISNSLFRSVPEGTTCPAATSDVRTEWHALVPEGRNIISSLTTGVEIPEGRQLCFTSTGSISLSATVIGYIDDL